MSTSTAKASGSDMLGIYHAIANHAIENHGFEPFHRQCLYIDSNGSLKQVLYFAIKDDVVLLGCNAKIQSAEIQLISSEIFGQIGQHVCLYHISLGVIAEGRDIQNTYTDWVLVDNLCLRTAKENVPTFCQTI